MIYAFNIIHMHPLFHPKKRLTGKSKAKTEQRSKNECRCDFHIDSILARFSMFVHDQRLRLLHLRLHLLLLRARGR